jgi:hypothetical protein
LVGWNLTPLVRRDSCVGCLLPLRGADFFALLLLVARCWLRIWWGLDGEGLECEGLRLVVAGQRCLGPADVCGGRVSGEREQGASKACYTASLRDITTLSPPQRRVCPQTCVQKPAQHAGPAGGRPRGGWEVLGAFLAAHHQCSSSPLLIACWHCHESYCLYVSLTALHVSYVCMIGDRRREHGGCISDLGMSDANPTDRPGPIMLARVRIVPIYSGSSARVMANVRGNRSRALEVGQIIEIRSRPITARSPVVGINCIV